MANKIFIRPLTSMEEINATEKDADGKNVKVKKSSFSGGDVMIFPLTEDVQFTVGSELQSWSDMVPGLAMLNTLQSVVVGVSGTVSSGVLNLQNLLDAPRWSKTNPLEFTVSLGFYTIDNAYKNVYKPMRELISLTILSRNKKGHIVPPGLFLPATAATREKVENTQKLENTAKLVSVKIPGIITMPVAMLKSAVPTFSKHLTEKGYPLWGKLEVNVVGLRAAFAEDFNGGR